MIHLVWLHFLGDYLFQTDNMATKKATELKWLTLHAIVYSIPFTLISIRFALITLVYHFTIDYFTSKVTSYLGSHGFRYWMFKSIGFDQAIHLTILVLTYAKFVHK
jgi:hypothetical protein